MASSNGLLNYSNNLEKSMESQRGLMTSIFQQSRGRHRSLHPLLTNVNDIVPQDRSIFELKALKIH